MLVLEQAVLADAVLGVRRCYGCDTSEGDFTICVQTTAECVLTGDTSNTTICGKGKFKDI